MAAEDIKTVGLTDATHSMLKLMEKDGTFGEMRDGYRLGIALAIAKHQIAAEPIKTTTIFSLSTLDPDGSIKAVVVELFPEVGSKPYAFAERLAEWGVSYLGSLHAAGHLCFTDIFREIADAGKAAGA